MIGKRFELTKSDIEDFRIYDYKKEDAYFIDCDKHTGKCLVDLLNELYEEKEQLQSRINDYDVALKTLQELTEKKLKENERLKKEVKAKDEIIELYYELVKE